MLIGVEPTVLATRQVAAPAGSWCALVWDRNPLVDELVVPAHQEKERKAAVETLYAGVVGQQAAAGVAQVGRRD